MSAEQGERCQLCGSPVEIVSSDEGTLCYRPASAEQGDVDAIREALNAYYYEWLRRAHRIGNYPAWYQDGRAALDRLSATLTEQVAITGGWQNRTLEAEAALESAERENELLKALDEIEPIADLRARAMRAERALVEIRENALSWHGPLTDTGHERALAVIATWADAALRPSEEASDEFRVTPGQKKTLDRAASDES